MTATRPAGTMTPMRRPLSLLVWGLFALLPAVAAAKSTLTVRPSSTSIELGETIDLRIRAASDAAKGNQQFDIVPPDMGDWEIIGQAQSTRIDAFRGTRATTVTLTLRPRKAGTLVIGAFTLKIPGDPVTSSLVSIQVRDGGVASPTAPAGQGVTGDPNAQAPAADQAPDEIVFMRWEVDRTDVWLGEQLDARLYVYIREGIGVRDFKVGEIDLTGFWNEARDQNRRPRTRKVVVGGLRFERQEVARYTLFPLRAGTPALPEIKAETTVRRMRRFGGPRSQVTRVADAVPITVKALPVPGRPKGFAGTTVGRARLKAKVDRRQIEAGDGVQLTVTTRIDGLIQNAPPIELPALEGFKIFPATDDTRSDRRSGKMTGHRSQTWLLRPIKGGKQVIPALELPYFDPVRGRYAVARTAPISIQVKGEPGVVTDDGIPLADDGPALRDIRPARQGASGPRGELGWWFQAALYGAPLLFALAWIRDRLGARRDATAGTRAARTAARDARTQLDRIGRKTSDARAGYSEVARSIVDYLETRFEAPFNGLTRDATRKALLDRGLDAGPVDALLEELDACDFARFAPAADAASGLAAACTRAADAIDAVERGVS